MKALFLGFSIWGMMSLSSWIWGRLLLSRFDDRFDPWERNVFAWAAGWGVLGMGLYALGLLKVLHPVPVWAWVAAPGLLLPGTAPKKAFAGVSSLFHRPVGGAESVLAAFVLSSLAFCLLTCGAPPVVHDALAVHLTLPQMYLRHGAISFQPSIDTSLWPALASMLYVPGLAVGSAEAAQFVQFGFGVVLLWGVGRAAARGGSRRLGWAAAGLLLCTPHFTRLALTALVDMGVAFYAFLALTAALRARDEDGFFWTALAGVFGGIGVSVKLNGVLWLLSFVFLWKGPLRERVRRSAVLLAIAAAVSSPWWMRSWILSGNPVWPYAWGLFGGPFWDARQLEIFSRYASGEVNTAGLTYGARLLQKAVDVVAWKQGIHPFRGFLFPVFGGALLWRGKKALPPGEAPVVRVILPYVAAYLLFMPLSPRYLSLMAPWAALGIAWTFFPPLDGVRWKGWPVVGGVLLLAWPAAPLREPRLREKASVACGLEERSVFLSRSLPGQAMADWVRLSLPADARIILLTDIRGYYLDRDVIWGSPLYQKFISYDGVGSRAELVSRWKASGATHVLWWRGAVPWPVDGLEALEDFVGSAVPLRTEGEYVLYDLSAAPAAGGKKGI